ncbi:UPF0182 family membrane protein [Catellatospora tritici]|uniref:UPF0182 family membrane protein n=1 Tax=Catellatospora tritici TaxID=2851566 RepID=UPI001C2DED05|nr:UPF0182 family protein [Catellatospora tritici]MBV1849006.1 UPF0182 family protein [Catellatospora tritici]
MSRRGRAWLIVLTGLLVFFALIGWVVDTWTEWLWFDELGATRVFTGQLGTRLGLFAVFGLIIGAFLFGNLYLAYKLRPFLPPTGVEQQTLERYRYLLGPHLNRWFALLSGVIAFFAGLAAQGHWQQWLLFENAVPFGQKDPQFGTDIGFYVFKLPFWQYLLNTGFTVTVLALLGAMGVHYLYGGVRLAGPGDRMTTGARAHLTSLVALFVILKAIAYVLDRRALLLDTITGTGLTGAGYTDVHALLPAKEMLTYISVIVAIAILIFSNAWLRNLTWPGVALGLLAISAVAIGGIYPWGVQTFQVDPSRNSREAPYIERAIASTRSAYGLDAAVSTPYSSETLVPPASLAQDKTIVPNIRLLDPAVVPETYTQFSQVRSFYQFGDKLDIDRYTVDGKLADYVVGVREIEYSKLSAAQNNWINRHTVFTHGYGLVAAPANTTVCNGQPFFVSGFFTGQSKQSSEQGCSSPTDKLPVEQPRIYYGERMSDYAVVGSSDGAAAAEYDRPTGDTSDARYTYTGKGGVDIGSTWRRLLYSIKYAESKFLLADAVNGNSKILYERDPRDRVQKVAPFLTLDGDPYPAAVNGRIVWIVDGYTTSANFPYSQRIDLQDATSDSLTGDGTFRLAKQEINYIRNSVKATVDAYDGTVTLYEFDDKDPVLKAWNKAFGGKLITRKDQIPAELAEHFRYPADMFKVQRDLLTRFHVNNANDFFNAPDFWAVPNDPAGHGDAKQPPYYLLTQLPGQTEARFQLTSAVTPQARQNLAALISGSYVDGKPVLEVLELNKDNRIPGPGQAQQQMENDGTVRNQLNIWGPNVVKGNLLSLPYGGGMLYVEPIYLRSSGEKTYPLLEKVLLSYGDKVAFADTIADGIKQLVGTSTGTPPVVTPEQPQPPTTATPLAAAAAKVDKAIDDLRAAQQKGDFEAYGKALAALDAAIKEFETANAAANPTGTTPTPTPSPTPTTG